ncbi:MAG: NADPH-dependent 7-cyano-7-deazaguanine reductase QueF [Pseudomonadota bacterium]|nr:NADPH-dependent 7-cyano-7-deazaguanine reductase QueF [Pseudomonadota bacterium]
MTTLDCSPLGKPTDYPERYDPALLFPVARASQREALGLHGQLPFGGVDLWTAYEITWVDAHGKPQVAIGEFRVPADSPSLIESKSLKLYLGSFAQEPASGDEIARRLEADLAHACGTKLTIALSPAANTAGAGFAALPGESLDEIALATDVYEPDPGSLTAGGEIVDETLRSALFRSRCPVTGQPDYGDVMIRYRGSRIDRAGLLRYLISFRRHAAFHESCVERIFVDILGRCAPRRLTVYARFLRRGGVDINPFRSNFEPAPPEGVRTSRQ